MGRPLAAATATRTPGTVPYHYWTRKARGKTVGMHLTEDEVVLYQEWIENNRELERIVTEMRDISSRVLALHNRPGGPLNRRVSGSSAAVTANAILQTLRPRPLTVPSPAASGKEKPGRSPIFARGSVRPFIGVASGAANRTAVRE